MADAVFLRARAQDLAALLPNLSQIRRPSKSSIVNSSIAHIHASRRHRLLAARELRDHAVEPERDPPVRRGAAAQRLDLVVVAAGATAAAARLARLGAGVVLAGFLRRVVLVHFVMVVLVGVELVLVAVELCILERVLLGAQR